MKKLYRNLPASDVDVERLIVRLSAQLGVGPPLVKFWSSGLAKYEPDERTIYLHTAKWMELYDPECTGPCFWGSVLMHEMAHYLDHQWNGQVGHTPEMYAIQTGLVLLEDLPLADYEKHECKYKPLSFMRGKRKAGVSILEDEKGEAIWTT